MESRLGAGACCQSCREPFGHVDDWKAPFTISCGHIFCVGCLNVTSSTCRVCGNLFDRGPISRLLMIYGDTPRRSSITTSEDECSRIQGEIAAINPDTPISRLALVYTQGRYFLESQPRNLCKDLSSNLDLLECLLEAKHALLAQNAFVDSLAERIRQVRDEKEGLQRRLDAQTRQHAQEVNGMRRYLSIADENFKRAADEGSSLREELKRAKDSLRILLGERSSATAGTTAIVPPDQSAPTIRVHPASRSPSIASAAARSPGTQSELSPLELCNRFSRNPHETGGPRPVTIHRSSSFHSLSSEGGEASPTESLFISPFGSDLAYIPNDGSEYGHDDDQLYASRSDADTYLDHRTVDIGDSFLNTLVSQAPSVEDEATIAGNDHTTAHEDEEYDADDDIMAMSTTALPILRTPESRRGVPPENNTRSNDDFWRYGLNIPTPIRTGPTPFLANLAILHDLLNDPVTARVASNASANILSRAAELLSPGNLARLADNSPSGQHPVPVPNLIQRPPSNRTSQGFSMAEMRSCLVEVLTRVFMNLASDPATINQQSGFASVYASSDFSGFLDSLMESSTPLPSDTTNLDPTADLIDFF
ncbi:hypothetical protein M413DRAFT_387939 [Hebeloma cylindrosporum]|uniref:RING-type domain-containing protein n=1 Tax=Hebeloma cylindrosporum TaxID=76867 RepID=A0A0C3CJ48_HEBCY|nr:hypothetical protein M413DRAFT_387939 [Hebeloma cylindrosporum h7]